MGIPKGNSVIVNGRFIHFTNNIVENGAGNGVWLNYFYYGLFHNNMIQNHYENGVRITHSKTDVFRNIIQKNGQGMEVDGRVTIHGNFIQRNDRNGIYLNTSDRLDIHDNDIHHNGASGIVVKKGYPRIHSNAIYGNYTGVTVASNWPLLIRNNDFKNNQAHGIEVLESVSKYTGIQALHNWWGGTGGPNNPTNDNDLTKGHINYQPWLNRSASKFFVNKRYNQKRPKVPQYISGLSRGYDASIVWNPNTDDDLLIYHVYKSSRKSSGYERIASTTQSHYLDYAIVPHKTYYYKISAVDFSGNESWLSKAVEVRFNSDN